MSAQRDAGIIADMRSRQEFEMTKPIRDGAPALIAMAPYGYLAELTIGQPFCKRCEAFGESVCFNCGEPIRRV